MPDRVDDMAIESQERVAEETHRGVSAVFRLAAGEPLGIRRDLAEQLPELIGQTYREIRASFGISTMGGREVKLQVVDGIARIQAMGPITRYDNICSALFGGVSVEGIRAQLQAALESPAVSGILLEVDSPGGTVSGVGDLADEIRAASEIKPIYAFVDSQGTSAAYWLAASAQKVIVSQTGFVGSIGVYAIYSDDSERRAQSGVKPIQIISSQSPRKVPDPTQDEGRAQIQSHIDELAEIFIRAIAGFRGVSTTEVGERYGQGDIVIAADAVERGMADRVGTLQSAFELLRGAVGDAPRIVIGAEAPRRMSMTVDELKAQHPAAASALIESGATEGAQAERERIQGILKLRTEGNQAVVGELIDAAIADGRSTAGDVALQILEQQKASAEAAARVRAQDAAQIPAMTPEATEEADAEKAAAQMIGNAGQKIREGK